MSRKLLAFLLSELKTVRLICQNPACGCVAEVPLQQLVTGVHECGMCHFRVPSDGTGPNALALLGRAILSAQAIDSKVRVEFVLPDDGDSR